MQIIREIRNFYVALCHVCFRRGFFIPSGFGMQNRPQKPIFEVDFRSRLSTPISDCVSSALGIFWYHVVCCLRFLVYYIRLLVAI